MIKETTVTALSSEGSSAKDVIWTGGDRRGFIIAAYPAMGQEIYLTIHDDAKILYVEDYAKSVTPTDEHWVNKYVAEAIRLVTTGGMKVCFVEPVHVVIEALGKLNEAFIVLYPGVGVEQYISKMYEMFPPNVLTAKRVQSMVNHALSYYDDDIRALRMYNNSIKMSTGIIQDKLINTFTEIPTNGQRLRLLEMIANLKTAAY